MPNNSGKKRIYLDNAATTPVDPEVLAEMLPYFSEKFGNASSFHSFGKEAEAAVELARQRAAKHFNASPEEIVFTSGATESNNLAIKGVVRKYYERNKDVKMKPHIITLSFEHHCVLDNCKSIEDEGLGEVTFILPEADGVVKAEKVMSAIKPNTILISIMYVNNEIGTVQPIAELGKMIAEANKQREQKIIFHTDATQAIDYFSCDVDELGVDLLSMSAHKIYGPKGVGMLYIRKGTPITKIQSGGGHERKMRAGTLNVTGIVGLGKALEMIDLEKGNIIAELRDYFIDRILKEIPDTTLNGSRELRSPNNANISFKNVEGESLLMLLDMEGIACSTGSACSSDSLEPSHVLLSIGKKHEEAHGSIRITLGKYNTKDELDYTAERMKEAVAKLRKVSGGVLSDFYEENKDGFTHEHGHEHDHSVGHSH